MKKAIHHSLARGRLPARQLSMVACFFVALCGISVLIAYTAARSQQRDREEALDVAVANATDHLVDHLGLRLRALGFLQAAIRDGRVGDDPAFDLAAETIHGLAPELLAVNLIDADRRIVRVWPPAGNEAAIGRTVGQTPAVLNILEAARDDGRARATGMVDLFQGGKGVATYFPIRRNGVFLGFVNGVFRIDGLDDIVSNPATPDLRPRLLAVVSDVPTDGDTDLRRTVRIPLLDRTLLVEIADVGNRRAILELLLLFGVSIVLSAVASILFASTVRARNEAMRREAMLGGILSTTTDAVVSVDDASRILVFNPAAEAMFGVTASEILGQSIDRLMPPAARTGHRGHVRDAATVASPVRQMGDWRQVRGLRADGTEFPVMASLGRSRFDGRTLMTAILRDMSEMQRLHEEMVALADERMRQVQKAEAANHAKSMFLATMSHELRTPLNAIIGFSSLAAREVFGKLGDPRYRQYLIDIQRSGEDLLAIINDVLDISKLEAGAYDFAADEIDLRNTLSPAVALVEHQLREKGIAFVFDVPVHLMVRADNRAVRQIAVNLLTNALKFTEPGGTVTLGAALPAPSDAVVTFEVSDTGRGIAPEDLARLGQPFVQVGDAYLAETKGTGLGLAICRSFAEGMGGRLLIRSTVGKGTSVSVELPRAAPR